MRPHRVSHAIALLCTTLSLFAVGCAGQKPMGQEAGGLARPDSVIQDVKGLPKWVTQKGAAFSGERRVFHGVGNAAGLQNPSLRRRAAEGQARRDIAQTMQSYVAALQKQYMAETTAGDMSKQSVEQHITDTMKQVTEATLVGAQIIEYWEHPLRNEAYALARLDLEQFLDVMKSYQSAVGNAKELDAKVREYVRQNAAKAHDELNQELAKKSGGSAVSTPAPSPSKGKVLKKALSRDLLLAGEFMPLEAGNEGAALDAADLVDIAYSDLVEIAGGVDLVSFAGQASRIEAAEEVEISYGDLIAIAEATEIAADGIEVGASSALGESTSEKKKTYHWHKKGAEKPLRYQEFQEKAKKPRHQLRVKTRPVWIGPRG